MWYDVQIKANWRHGRMIRREWYHETSSGKSFKRKIRLRVSYQQRRSKMRFEKLLSAIRSDFGKGEVVEEARPW